ncbi:unnamed protein product [Ectocarpus sp. 12 AP-2014]
MAFRATQAVRMVVKKTSTGLVGLAVDVNARANFIALQKQILEKIKVIPDHAQYRKDVEAISGYRLKVATETEDEETIEDEINHGQLEELLVDGKNELKLIDKYAEWRLWEAVDELNEADPERQEA